MFSNVVCQVLVKLWGKRVGTFWVSRAEVETFYAAAHLVMVTYHVRHPVEVHCNGILALRVLAHQPVTVAVCPIMVGTAAWPRLRELTGTCIRYVVVAVGGIYPIGKTVDAVGIKTGIDDDDGVFQNILNGRVF